MKPIPQDKGGPAGEHRRAADQPKRASSATNYTSNSSTWMPSRCTFTAACLAGLSIGLAIAVVIPPSGGLLA